MSDDTNTPPVDTPPEEPVPDVDAWEAVLRSRRSPAATRPLKLRSAPSPRRSW